MRADAGEVLLNAWSTAREQDPEQIYDEVLREVSARAARDQSLGKADIGALVVWKRLNASTRWARNLMLTPEREVRSATGRAWELATDSSLPIPEAGAAARDALRSTPGMGGTGAIASAVLVTLAPHRMAVWDRRVSAQLRTLECHPGDSGYGGYLAVCLDLATEMHTASAAAHRFTPRDVDLALFHAAANS